MAQAHLTPTLLFGNPSQHPTPSALPLYPTLSTAQSIIPKRAGFNDQPTRVQPSGVITPMLLTRSTWVGLGTNLYAGLQARGGGKEEQTSAGSQ